MENVNNLRERLVGQRFYDTDQEEAFTVVGFTEAPSLALLQYDDGVAWDEAASNFTLSEEVAERAGVEEHGLDSERHQPLGPGPRIEQICEPGSHKWYPKPDKLWPEGPSEEVREQIRAHPRDFYDRIARCKRCGLSGSVVGQFGTYGSQSSEPHAPPWFCTNCYEVHSSTELVYKGDFPYCPDCAAEIG